MEQWYEWGPIAVIALTFVGSALKFIHIQHNTIRDLNANICKVVDNNTNAMNALGSKVGLVEGEVRNLGKRVEGVEETLKGMKGE